MHIFRKGGEQDLLEHCVKLTFHGAFTHMCVGLQLMSLHGFPSLCAGP